LYFFFFLSLSFLLRKRDPLTSPLREFSLSTSQIDISSLVTVSWNATYIPSYHSFLIHSLNVFPRFLKSLASPRLTHENNNKLTKIYSVF
jgi:hypothetical protein